MAVERLDNSKEVRVTRSKNKVITHPATHESWGDVAAWDEVVVDKIEDAVLYPYMYDATKIFYKDSLGTNLSLNDSIKHFDIDFAESVGERRSFEMNMSSRLDVNSADHWNEKIYYSDSFTYNPDTGFYSLVIYTPIQSVCGDKTIGYVDSVISITENMSAPEDSAWLRTSVEYRTNLPPSLIQGIPKKLDPDEEDPVFPASATRVDIGVNQIPDYYTNSQGFEKDYLFTNSSAMYVADASGFIPASIADDYEFKDVSAYLEDSTTSMRTPIAFEESEHTIISEKSADITVDGETTSYSAHLERVIWRSKIETDQKRGPFMNLLTIESSIEPTTEEV